MPVMMIMQWNDVTPEQYDAVREEVGWEREAPNGGVYHVCAFEGDTMHITDVWESAEDFDSFVNNRLMPGVQKVGIPGEPVVKVLPAHRVFAPGYE
ncbi:hypothetical protein K8I61_10235 [bacterium]|nr:hypothetical protein [bacterium]